MAATHRFHALEVKTVTTFDNEGRLITSKRDGVASVMYTYDRRGNVTRTNANLLASDEVIGYDADSREISRGVAIAGGAMVTCRRYNAMGDVVRIWGPARTANVSTCPVETAPTPIIDTAYHDHHRPSRVTRYMAAADGGNRVTETVYNADDSVKSVRKAVGTGLEQGYEREDLSVSGPSGQHRVVGERCGCDEGQREVRTVRGDHGVDAVVELPVHGTVLRGGAGAVLLQGADVLAGAGAVSADGSRWNR